MRQRVRPWALWGLLLYLAAVSVVLLAPGPPTAAIDVVVDWLRGPLGWEGFRFGWVEFAANVALFVPLGLFAAALWPKLWVGALLALVVSAGAEIAQLALPARTTSARDIVANVVGAVLGSALAWLVLRARIRRESPRAPQEPRSGSRDARG